MRTGQSWNTDNDENRSAGASKIQLKQQGIDRFHVEEPRFMLPKVRILH